jgi:hypothetical protein
MDDLPILLACDETEAKIRMAAVHNDPAAWIRNHPFQVGVGGLLAVDVWQFTPDGNLGSMIDSVEFEGVADAG